MANITIVDDSHATVEMLSSILSMNQHNVTTYSNSQGVENNIAANKPDLIFLDIVMPERNGYEVLRSLKRNPETKNIPVIFISNKSEETDIKWGKRQGASDYVTNPFTAETILNAVNSQI